MAGAGADALVGVLAGGVETGVCLTGTVGIGPVGAAGSLVGILGSLGEALV